MKIQSESVRSGVRRIAPRAALALGVAVVALVGAVTACAMEARGERGPSAADDSVSAAAVLAAVRGEPPLACSFTARTFENRWGSPHRLGGPDAAALDDAQASAFDWAMGDRISTDVLPMLQRAMGDADACVRRIAAQLVGRIGGKDLADRLRSELTATDATRREMAVLALGYSGEKTSESALASVATDAEPRVRRTAAWALGRTDNDAAVSPLVGMLRDADAMVRVNAALSLGSLSATVAVDPLSSLLASDGDPRVRRAAAAALGQIDKN